MNDSTGKNTVGLKKLLLLTVAFPSIILGAFTMHYNNIPIYIWGQNIMVTLIVVLISYLFTPKASKYAVRNTTSSYIKIALIAVLFLLAYIDAGFMGVHRWISIGPFRFYISSIVLPVLMIELWKILSNNNWILASITTIAVSIIIALQPDASQLTAFNISMMILFYHIKTDKKLLKVIVIAILLALVPLSWVFLDSLPPVSYVEEILFLVADLGTVWLVLGITSLAILPLPFILFSPRNSQTLSRCIGLYFIIILISTQFGNFPVPLMGYGISPILGYYIAINWRIQSH